VGTSMRRGLTERQRLGGSALGPNGLYYNFTASASERRGHGLVHRCSIGVHALGQGDTGRLQSHPPKGEGGQW
jgi:hypothetical protein